MDSFADGDWEDRFMPSCEVVIPTRHRPMELDRCLQAVTHLDYARFDVLVVDNSPRDNRTQEVAARWGVRYVIEPCLGVNRARNRGARASKAEIIAYLDDDAVPQRSWLMELVSEFRNPQVMAVAGRILPLQVATEAERLFVSRGGFDSGEEQRSVDLHTQHWVEMTSFGGLGSEANMAFRRSAFDIWPGFNERIGYGTPLPGGSGPFAFLSLIERGYRVVYTPRAIVSHPSPQTLEALHSRHRRTLATSAGYWTMLFFEYPRYRRAMVRFLAGWFRSTPRAWGRPGAEARPRIVPRWRELLACLPGPLLYARATLAYKLSRRGS